MLDCYDTYYIRIRYTQNYNVLRRLQGKQLSTWIQKYIKSEM